MGTQKTLVGAMLVALAAGVGWTVSVWPKRQLRSKAESISSDLPKHEGERKIDTPLPARDANGVAPALPKFIGYLTSGSDTLFALSLAGIEGGINSSGFMRIGENFGAYRIVSFD